MPRSSIEDLPPFPEGLNLAPIARISSRKLLDGDRDEAVRVLEATQTYGFFYLDLQDSPRGERLLEHSEQLLAVAQRVFDQPDEEKRRHMLEKGKSLFGYKAAGTVKKTDKDARPDATEFFNVSKDHVHGVTASRSIPAEIEEAKALFQEFTRGGP